MNPAAGHGKAMEQWLRVHRRLKHRHIKFETFISSRPGHATDLARQAVEAGFTTILAVGGDGTIHEVVNGFKLRGALRDDVRLSVLPAGTGSDFVRNAGLRRGIDAAVRRILLGTEKRVDVGISSREEKVFVNFAETGIGAATVAREAQLTRTMPGRASFFFAAIDAVRQQENITARIAVDGQEVYNGRLLSAVVANGRYFGGGIRIAPRASMSDGLFDVIVLGDFSRGQLLTQIWKIYPGVHLRHSKVAWTRGRRVEIEPIEPGHLDLDGELYEHGTHDFNILPAALRVLV